MALAREITTYNNSVLGVLKAISNDRDALNFDVAEIMDKFYNFNSYSENEYGNKETDFLVSEITCVGAIFEGGKDFEYDGTTYYYILSAIG